MRMAPDQRVIRTRANRAYARLYAGPRFRRRCCCGQGRGGPVGAEDRDGGRATPSDAPTTRSCACHGAWNGRAAEEPGIGATRTPDMTSLAPLRFWVRGAAREAVHRWSGWVDLVATAAPLSLVSGDVQTTRVGRAKGCPKETTCPGSICGAEVRTAGRPSDLERTRVPRQNLIRLGQERRDPSIRPQAKTPSLVGGRATGIVRPSALHGHTGVAMEDGEQVGWAAELDLGRVFDGSEDSRCWTTPPGGGSGDAGHRLRESPRSCPPRGARRA